MLLCPLTGEFDAETVWHRGRIELQAAGRNAITWSSNYHDVINVMGGSSLSYCFFTDRYRMLEPSKGF